jgi:hypothetical protein
MFVRFDRVLGSEMKAVSVNTDNVTWAQQDGSNRVLLKVSDGPDLIVVGTLDDVERKLNAASTVASGA